MHRLSLVAVSGGLLFVVVVASLVAEQGSRRVGFSSCGVWPIIVVAHGLCCSVACGVFLDQGSNLRALHWQVDS